MNKKRALSLAREWARGLLRKTNYMAQVMISAAEDYQKKWCDECDLRVENIRWGQVASEQDKAVERLQEENEKLRNSRDRWRKCAEEFSAGVNQRDNETEKLQTENEKLQAELEQEHAHRLHAEQHADAFLEDCKRLEAELEQVKRERDAIEQDFCVFTKQWLEEGSGFPCRWCKYENTGRCEWKESHPTCQDVCFGKFFEWRGPHKEG